MKKILTGKRFPCPSIPRIVTGILLVALCLSNVAISLSNAQLRDTVASLQAEMNERFNSSVEDMTNTANTVGALRQAVMMGVNNKADFLTFLEMNNEAEAKGVSPYRCFYDRIEPARIPSWATKCAERLDGYEVQPCHVFEHHDGSGGSTTKIGGALQLGDDACYGFGYADEYRVTVDLDELALNPYGIFEGNIYVLYDDGTDGRTSGNIQIYVYNETDRARYRADIPFTFCDDTTGIKLDKDDTWSVLCSDGKIVFTFVACYGDEALEVPETYARREVGGNMIGDVMVYSRTAYDELPA